MAPNKRDDIADDEPERPTPWGKVFRTSTSRYGGHKWAVRRPYQDSVESALSRVGRSSRSGGPGFDGWREFWTTPYGPAEACGGGFFSGMWVDDIELLLYLCERMNLTRPRFADEELAKKALEKLGGR